MQDPRTPRPESVGWGGAPGLRRFFCDRRGMTSSPFGFLATAIASVFIGGMLIAGRYGGEVYHDVIRTLERNLGL